MYKAINLQIEFINSLTHIFNNINNAIKVVFQQKKFFIIARDSTIQKQ